MGFECPTVTGQDKTTVSLYVALSVFSELPFSVLITWSSIAMIVFLCRHREQVQHIHSTSGFHSNFPESRAIQNILVRVFSFLAIYTCSMTHLVAVVYYLFKIGF